MTDEQLKPILDLPCDVQHGIAIKIAANIGYVLTPGPSIQNAEDQPFTAQQKLESVKREIKMRQQVYPRWVAAGRLTQQKALHEVAVMEAIAKDYEQLAATERLI